MPTPFSKAEFINLVLDNQRLEPAFEFKHRYDIKRRKLGDAVFKGPNPLEPRPALHPNRDYLMPLPALALAINPNLAPKIRVTDFIVHWMQERHPEISGWRSCIQ